MAAEAPTPAICSAMPSGVLPLARYQSLTRPAMPCATAELPPWKISGSGRPGRSSGFGFMSKSRSWKKSPRNWPGFVMHRYAHRLFAGALPGTTYATDGAEMGKAMVAAGLGISVLPDFSITGDPLVRAGVLTTRPILTDQTTVTLLMLRRRAERTSEPLRDLQTALVRQARAHLASLELPATASDPTSVTPIRGRARTL